MFLHFLVRSSSFALTFSSSDFRGDRRISSFVLARIFRFAVEIPLFILAWELKEDPIRSLPLEEDTPEERAARFLASGASQFELGICRNPYLARD